MNLKEIQQLIDIINKSDLGEATIEEGDFKITLKRSSSLPPAVPAQPLQAHVPAPVATPAPAPQATEKPSAAQEGLVEIKSPIVGTFYSAPSPESAPFVKINDTIQQGTVLCIVEAMKLMNEIEAEVSGTIVEILVDNGQPVEYDQPLFLVKP
ncbi:MULTISPECIES: acetyl-CoA carboxylase biotin carboxyl carrier protein [Prosthecochloris]|uniref:Biotin carboxyl carrier protein of acetyl-CoA carboxylase n=1 Tax=Prosthecochloris vibrioformis TaxID=1098 RepID=A0A5C4RYI2_PROVB|nr:MULTISPECIES: acetyl-CoA carboxylase biotin carboxyl carrier protein [Prosthecochloris]ANT64073.1 Biotin carboxyl carrier protein of acetyl-CoA carboxylase [Prosthecochloris sp. CIB 2401]TNJ36356.1 acetyl-CoA carboxylase biotin carboxyl carrier protein [Prosthecochloris vibrioformis]